MKDKDLICGLKRNDYESQTEIYSKYKGCLIGYFVGRGVDQAIAEDLAHDAFIKVYEKASSISSSDYFDAWIWKIARNVLLDFYKKESRNNEQDVTEFEYLFPYSFESQFLLEDEVSRMLSYLSESKQTVIKLYDYEGYSHKEISKKLNISINTSKSHLKRARDKCRNNLEQWREIKIDKSKMRRFVNNKLFTTGYVGKYAN
mgnify:CR=1 FL=1